MIAKKNILGYGVVLMVTAAWIALAFCLGAGCAGRVAHVTDLPAGVTEQQAKDWDAAVADLHKIADVTSSLRQAVLTLRGSGAFPDDKAYGTTILAIGHIDELQLAATNVLRQQPQHFDSGVKGQITGLLTNIGSEIQNLNTNGVTGIKNPDSLKQVNGFITTLTNVLGLVKALSK